jgi:endonuclease/exonuclease/phosphatase family metal-dependent hydrolase
VKQIVKHDGGYASSSVAPAASGAHETQPTLTPNVSASAQLRRTPAQAPLKSMRRLRAFFVACAFAYLVALLIVTLGFYYVGEGWWVTAAGLYAPRLAFALPLPFGVIALLALGLRRFLWTQLVSSFLLLFPLMGFVLPGTSAGVPGVLTIRVLSFNVDSGFAGNQAVADKIFAASPDVVLLQETPFWGGELAVALRARYPYVEGSTQFIVASRYRIVTTTDPERLNFYGRMRSPRFMRYLIDTPLGPIVFYNVHPISPRGVLHVHQFRAALHQLRTGELFAGDPEADVRSNVGLRALQIETAAAAASRESLPVVVVGDTNLPGLSGVLRKNLSGFTDGFRSASWGFGYTFPSSHPFLRLDRMMVSRWLRFSSFQIDCEGVSDHLCIMAELQAGK